MSYPSIPRRFLKSTTTSPPSSPTTPETATVDSDFVVILAALLCALICVLGLIAVARCAWIRRFYNSSSTPSPPHHAPNPKGLKKKVLRTLPKLTFSDEISSPKLADCPICLTEFSPGDELRVLPQCGHAFHLTCVDTWLESHSSCPSCRQILVVTRCKKCGGGIPPSPTMTATDSGGGSNCGGDTAVEVEGSSSCRGNSFLP